MGNWLNLTTRVSMGNGELSKLPAVTAEYGKSAFLVYDPFLNGSPTLNAVLAGFDALGISVTTFSDVASNPRDTAIDAAAALCCQNACDVVVAIGGGSAIDSAKVVALIGKNGGKAWEYTQREGEYIRLPENGRLPLVVVPTTAGTGTEVTPYAVVNNPRLLFKATVYSDVTRPDAAIVDPELMTSMPRKLTALTGIDAFAHAFESYINRNATEFSDMVSLEAIRLFAENIRTACVDGQNCEARRKLAIASLLGGVAIAHAGTTLPHAIGQPLSGLTDVSHGGSIASCIGAVIRWTLPYGEAKFAKVAEILNPALSSLSDKEKAEQLPDIIKNLFVEILDGADVSMTAAGLKEEQVEKIADMIITCYSIDCGNHPRTPQKKDLIDIIHDSM